MKDESALWETEAGVAVKIARGDVRLYQFAPPGKRRPIVVLTRDSALAYLSTVTVAPITSTMRGVPSEVLLNADDGMKTAARVKAQAKSKSPTSRNAEALLPRLKVGGLPPKRKLKLSRMGLLLLLGRKRLFYELLQAVRP
jgi:mRNA-degrading endonuclease toxin of MazEF toxin-antitoxin module